MDLGQLPLFQMMSKRLAWLGKRQQVLAQNVAHADTPKYRAQDIKEPSFRELLGGTRTGTVAITRTSGTHLTPARGNGDAAFKVIEDEEGEFSLSGNSVDLPGQMTKVAKTAMDHQMTINLYRKHISMLKAALGRPGS